VSRLRKEYGGRIRKGSRSERTRKGCGSSVREPLQQLEKIGLVETVEKEGRRLTRKGRSILDKIATEIVKETKPSKVSS
jgi:small subunit ribosomal protein S19e